MPVRRIGVVEVQLHSFFDPPPKILFFNIISTFNALNEVNRLETDTFNSEHIVRVTTVQINHILQSLDTFNHMQLSVNNLWHCGKV
jgi:hypothetical protein